MFDHLRDHLRHDAAEMLQPSLDVAVLLDASALIARSAVPMMMTAPDKPSDQDRLVLEQIGRLRKHVHFDLRNERVVFRPRGIERIVRLIGHLPWREPGSGILLRRIEAELAGRPAGRGQGVSLRVDIASVTVAGYYSLYRRAVGLAPNGLMRAGGRPTQDLRAVLWERDPTRPHGLDFAAVHEAQRRFVMTIHRSILARDPLGDSRRSPGVAGTYARLLDQVQTLRSSRDLPGPAEWSDELNEAVVALSVGANGADTTTLQNLARTVFVRELHRSWWEHSNALQFMRSHGNAIYPGSANVLEDYERDAHRRFARVLLGAIRTARQTSSRSSVGPAGAHPPTG